MVENEKRKSYGGIIALVIIIILIILFLVLATWQVPYVIKETHTESQPYQTTENYNQPVSTSGCDKVSGCTCLDKSWFGLGPCDSCNCEETRTVTAYHDVPVTTDETKYCSALSKLFGGCNQ